MIYFTSDLHFGHKNVIKYCQRPWATVWDMNEGLVNNWNAIIKPTDEVYVLGDVSFANRGVTESLVHSLKGRKYLVPGNHDNEYVKKDWFIALFERILPPIYKLKDNGQTYVLCHFPLLSWENMGKGTVHLHGHSHGALAFDPKYRRMDVGVDAWAGYAPISLPDIDFRVETNCITPTRPDRIDRSEM